MKSSYFHPLAGTVKFSRSRFPLGLLLVPLCVSSGVEKTGAIRTHEFDLAGLTAGSSVEQVLHGSADFVIGNLPLSQAEADQVVNMRGMHMLSLPTAIEATVPCYHLRGVTSGLNFSPDVLAGILLGRITKWNDEAIQSANPGIRLPNTSLVIVQRTDENGGTYAWTDYLSKPARAGERQLESPEHLPCQFHCRD